MDTEKEHEAWHKVGHKQRFLNAFRGLHVFWEATNSLFRYVSMFAIFSVVFFGFYFHVSNLEWAVLVFAIGLVIVSEAINTAIEIDIDLTSPQYHPFARDTKDVAAGAVILSVFTSIIIGLIVFLPKIF